MCAWDPDVPAATFFYDFSIFPCLSLWNCQIFNLFIPSSYKLIIHCVHVCVRPKISFRHRHFWWLLSMHVTYFHNFWIVRFVHFRSAGVHNIGMCFSEVCHVLLLFPLLVLYLSAISGCCSFSLVNQQLFRRLICVDLSFTLCRWCAVVVLYVSMLVLWLISTFIFCLNFLILLHSLFERLLLLLLVISLFIIV